MGVEGPVAGVVEDEYGVYFQGRRVEVGCVGAGGESGVGEGASVGFVILERGHGPEVRKGSDKVRGGNDVGEAIAVGRMRY